MTERGNGLQNDVRLGGRWSGRQRFKNDALWALALAVLEVTRPLPLEALRALGRGLGRGVHALAFGARRRALANVAKVFPDWSASARRELVARCFVTLGEALAECAACLRETDPPPLLPVSDDARALLCAAGSEHPPLLRRRGRGADARGVVFASAHLGPFERVAASLVAAGVPLLALARESYDPRFSRLVEAMRARSGVRALVRGRPAMLTAAVRHLRRGGVLGIAMDLRSRVPSCTVPFLGHAAPTPIGPARMALATGARVVVGSVERHEAHGCPDDATLTVTATEIPTHDLGTNAAGAVELTARINAELSRRIRALPHAWPWMHERWTPLGRGP